MKPKKCNHEGCNNTHKSETGFCHIHAADINKPHIQLPKQLLKKGAYLTPAKYYE